MPISVDSSGLPVLKVRYEGRFSDEELQLYLAELERVLRMPGKKVAIIDLRAAHGAPANQRRMQADWIGKHQSALKREFSAAVIVTDNALIRGVVTAIFWVRPLPFATHMAKDVAEAAAWLQPHLR